MIVLLGIQVLRVGIQDPREVGGPSQTKRGLWPCSYVAWWGPGAKVGSLKHFKEQLSVLLIFFVTFLCDTFFVILFPRLLL